LLPVAVDLEVVAVLEADRLETAQERSPLAGEVGDDDAGDAKPLIVEVELLVPDEVGGLVRAAQECNLGVGAAQVDAEDWRHAGDSPHEGDEVGFTRAG